jgi:expansin (peptidoglycan-binding protein)
MIYSYNMSQRDALFLKFIFDKGFYIIRTDLLSIIKSLNTVYAAIGICHASYVDCLLARSILTYIYTKLGVIFPPEHTFSKNEILLCDPIQSEFRVNTMNSIDHNIAGYKPANGAGMIIIKHGLQKNELRLYIHLQ